MSNPIAAVSNFLRRTDSAFLLSFIDYCRLLQGRRSMLLIDYVNKPECRWGHGRPPHEDLYKLIDANRDEYVSFIESFRQTASALEAVNLTEEPGSPMPNWDNNFYTGPDAVALYNMPLLKGSKTYLEIGSGYSTKWINRSRQDNKLDLKIVSVDPQPRAEIDTICDEVHRSPVEKLDRAFFDQLGRGDILMIDSSHRCLQSNDVTVLFLEVIPRLKPGVVVHVHDIFLPEDYPKKWARRYYSEQYILAAMLLSDQSSRYQPLFPVNFINQDEELSKCYSQLWSEAGPVKDVAGGSSFWFEVV